MARNDVMKQILAGFFFLLGAALIGGVILYIGFYRGVTRPQFQVTVLFDKIGGLMEGAPVRLSGVTVGTVKNISFLDQPVLGRSVSVQMGVFKRYETQVRLSTEVAIQTEGVLGAKYIEFSRDQGVLTLDIDRPIIGDPMLDVYDLAEVLEDTADAFNETTQGINTMMVELQYISRKTKRLLDRIERRVIDGNLFKVF